MITDRYIVEANFNYCGSKFCMVLKTNYAYKEANYCVTLWKQIILDKQILIIAEANLYCVGSKVLRCIEPNFTTIINVLRIKNNWVRKSQE